MRSSAQYVHRIFNASLSSGFFLSFCSKKNPSFYSTLNSTCGKGVKNEVRGNFTMKGRCAVKLPTLILLNSVHTFLQKIASIS